MRKQKNKRKMYKLTNFNVERSTMFFPDIHYARCSFGSSKTNIDLSLMIKRALNQQPIMDYPVMFYGDVVDGEEQYLKFKEFCKKHGFTLKR